LKHLECYCPLDGSILVNLFPFYVRRFAQNIVQRLQHLAESKDLADKKTTLLCGRATTAP